MSRIQPQCVSNFELPEDIHDSLLLINSIISLSRLASELHYKGIDSRIERVT